MSYSYLALLFSSISSAAASIFLKLATDISAESAWIFQVIGVTGLRIVAIACYGIGFVFYSVSLKSISLQAAYPIMVGTTILLLFVYRFVLSQSITITSIAGAVLICLGIFLLSLK